MKKFCQTSIDSFVPTIMVWTPIVSRNTEKLSAAISDSFSWPLPRKVEGSIHKLCFRKALGGFV